MAPMSCRPGLPWPHSLIPREQAKHSLSYPREWSPQADAVLCVGTGIWISTSSHLHPRNPTESKPNSHILLSTRFSEVSGRDNKMALPDLHYSDLLTSKSQHLWSTTHWPLQTVCVCLSLQMTITRGAFAVTVFGVFVAYTQRCH